MQIVLENANIELALTGPQPGTPEGLVIISFREGQIVFPFAMPRLNAIALAQRILDACRTAEVAQADGAPHEP